MNVITLINTHDQDMSQSSSKKPYGISIQKVLIIFRVLSSLFVVSYFQPDEFWQTLEPAHHQAFGYGKLTWEWDYGLRSYAFPFIFEILYRLVSVVSTIAEQIVAITVDCFVFTVSRIIPGSELAWSMVNEMQHFPQEIKSFLEYYGVIIAPKVMMALIGAVGEMYAFAFIEKLYTREFSGDEKNKMQSGKLVKMAACLLSTTNFFNNFMITRTFANTLEMDLTCAALYFWDWTGGACVSGRNFTISLYCGIFLCLQRPTNALIWVPLGLFLVLNLTARKDFKNLTVLVRKLLLVFLQVLAVNLAIDFYFYRELIFPVFRFIKFNYTSALSSFYGTAPWHFHLLQSLPLILGWSTPLFLYGFFCSKTEKGREGLNSSMLQARIVVIINIIAFSLISHKEFRFLYILHPFFLLFSSIALGPKIPTLEKMSNGPLKYLVWAPPFFSIIASLLVSSYHETGVTEVTKYLHHIPRIHSVGFIMPCHSTPWQSYIHRNDIQDIWSITCEPPLFLLEDPDAEKLLASYMDESDLLYDNVPKFIYQNMPPVFRKELRSPSKEYSHEWPEYLIIFQQLDDTFMKDFLKDSAYSEEARFFNTWSHWDSRRSGDIIVYRKPHWL